MNRAFTILAALMLLLAAPAALAKAGDLNDDGVVNGADKDQLMAAFNTSAGDAGYDASADLDGDGKVNVNDLNQLLLLLEE